MCEFGINPENFNPKLLFVFKHKATHNSHVNNHTHDFLELAYIMSGTCTYIINNEPVPVKKGDLIVCNPGVYHEVKLGPEEEMTEAVIAFNEFNIDSLPKNHLIPHDSFPLITHLKHYKDFNLCIEDMLAEQDKNEPGCALMLKSILIKLVVLFLKSTRTCCQPENDLPLSFESHEKAYVVETIIAFFNKNYMKTISLDRISRNMFLSPVYISKIFKEETGESPISYLIKLRLSKARNLLQQGKCSIKTAANSVGYDDAYYFSKLYKKYFGISPSKHNTG